MSAELRKQVEVELEQLGRLIDLHRPLLTQRQHSQPSPIELSALAAFLHTFYTGIENMFKRVRVELAQSVPAGEDSHQQLLQQMTRPATSRPAVISESVRQMLAEYLAFRHVFRHAYMFDLRWDKMAHLAVGVDNLFDQLRAELGRFLDSINA